MVLFKLFWKSLQISEVEEEPWQIPGYYDTDINTGPKCNYPFLWISKDN